MKAVRRPNELPTPEPSLKACAVIPAHNEAEHIAGCLEAFVGQIGVRPEWFEILLVLDHCSDETELKAFAFGEMHPQLRLRILTSPLRGAGMARRFGMDAACRRLLAVARPQGLIASTDADSIVAPDWLRVQLDAVAGGARAIGGRIELSDEDRAQLPIGALAWRDREGRAQHLRILAGLEAGEDAAPEQWDFSGASLSVTAETYRSVGGLEPQTVLEGEAFERTLARHGVPVVRLPDVRVTTSARTSGRAMRGLARDLSIASWVERRTYRSEDYDLQRVRAAKRHSVSFVLPARNVAGTIGTIIDTLQGFEAEGIIDEVVVVDAASPDGTAHVAANRGVTVHQESDLMAEFGPARGKGDAMWRGLSVTKGEIIVYVDTDTEDFQPNFVLGMLGPILEDPEIQLLKGTFRRPFKLGDSVLPEGGGRVTELLARPFLNLYVPELAGFSQPLAGEIAARRCLLEAIPFPVGYGIEIAMLIDSVRLVGVDALAQVDLGVRQNRHQSLRELAGMAYAVLAAASARLIGQDLDAYAPGPLALPSADGLEMKPVPLEERPPLSLTLAYEDEGSAEDAS